MSKRNPKTAKMYARVHPWVKEWFDKQDNYNAADALTYVANKKGDALEILKMRLEVLEKERDEKQMEVIELEMSIERIAKEIYKLSPEDVEEEFIIHVLDDVVVSIATRLFNQYGDAHGIEELLNNPSRIKGLRSEAHKLGVDLEDFKSMIIFEYNKLCQTSVSDISSENLE
ncbi:hypothetical protein [Methanobrevibacter sp.]